MRPEGDARVEAGEFLGDLGNLRLHSGFCIDAVALDAAFHTTQHPRAREHLQMGFQKNGDFFRRGAMQARRTGSGSRQPAAAKSPSSTGAETSTRRSVAVIERTPYVVPVEGSMDTMLRLVHRRALRR